MVNFPLPRIDIDQVLHDLLLSFCRISEGEIWIDDKNKHKVGCIDSANSAQVKKMMDKESASLAIQDPPYNFVAFEKKNLSEFIHWCEQWINISHEILNKNAALYIWLGADQNNHFQPLSDFIRMMSSSGFTSKSFITMRNQRGYGTQKNWMSIRQELLYYVKGNPVFNIENRITLNVIEQFLSYGHPILLSSISPLVAHSNKAFGGKSRRAHHPNKIR